MKHQISIIAALFSLTIVLLSGCVVSPEEDHSDLTKRGKEIFCVWNKIIAENIENYSNVAFVFNSYLEAEDSVAEQIRINDLGDALIVNQDGQDNVWLIIYNDFIYYKILTNDKTLSELGAEWEIIINMQAYNNYSENKHIRVTHNEATTWNIRITDDLYSASIINVSIIGEEVVPATIFNTDFKMIGNGHIGVDTELDDYEHISDGENVFMDFTITSPLQHNFFRVFSEGDVDLSVVNDAGERTNTSASFDIKSIYDNYALITYKDITKTLDLPLVIQEGAKWTPFTTYYYY